jgi:hypothetical protein
MRLGSGIYQGLTAFLLVPRKFHKIIRTKLMTESEAAKSYGLESEPQYYPFLDQAIHHQEPAQYRNHFWATASGTKAYRQF